MSQNQEHQPNQNKEIDPELVRSFLKYQQQQLQLEERRLMYEKERLYHNSKLAEKTMDINSQFDKDAPSQKRKTIIAYAAVGIVILLIFLCFILYCVSSGKEEFVKTFLNWISHFVTIALGFWVGRSTSKSNKKRSRDDEGIPEAELIN